MAKNVRPIESVMMISPIHNALSPSPLVSPSGGTVQSSSTSDQSGALSKSFMTLLITQLKHQNPLEPMESGDLLNQLAAMTSVSELRDIHASVDRLNDHLAAGQLGTATALLGQELAIDAGQFAIDGDSRKLTLAFPAPGAGHGMQFALTDHHGQLVAEASYQGRHNEQPGTMIRKSLQQLFGSLANGHYWLSSAVDGRDNDAPLHLISRADRVVVNGQNRQPGIKLAAIEPVPLSMIRSVAPVK